MHLQYEKEYPVIKMQGELISGVSELLEEKYQEIPQAHRSRVFLDFQETSYINSSGLAALIGLVSTARKEDHSIIFLSLKPHIEKVMGLVGLLDHVTVYPDLSMALKARDL